MDYKALGLRIKEVRSRKGIKQEELAEAVFISRSYMSQIENGERNLTIDTLIGISEYLKISLNYLLFDMNENDALVQQILKIISNCSIQRKKMIVEVITAITKYTSD